MYFETIRTLYVKKLSVRELMNAAVPSCLVTGYEHLIETLSLPDPDDRHVLAAAIHARAEIIVTFNLRDFPDDALKPFSTQAQHPDDFVAALFDVAPGVVCSVVKAQRESLRNPPKTAEELLVTLESQGLVQSVARLRAFLAVL